MYRVYCDASHSLVQFPLKIVGRLAHLSSHRLQRSGTQSTSALHIPGSNAEDDNVEDGFLVSHSFCLRTLYCES